MAAASHSAVPNYNVWGNQHHRRPYMDKSHLETENIQHARWLTPPPPIRSRSELLQARKRGNIPDPSYDFDGDGVVGQLDYFVGRCFDKDADGRLTPKERARAEQAVTNGFLDKYMRGIEATHPAHRNTSFKQKLGRVVTYDNVAEASAAYYPPHHNAHRVPPHPTKTALELSRKSEMKGYAQAVGEQVGQRCKNVLEPKPPTHETHPRECAIEHIRERAEADHQAARLRGGLQSMNTPVNPERELRTVGLGHDENPVVATRSQLLETRKEMTKLNCEEQRKKGDEVFVPLSVRRSEKEVLEFNFRRPNGQQKTLTTLKDDRKRDRIEHNMEHFGVPKVYPREYPRFSDREGIPFWIGSKSSPASPIGHKGATSPDSKREAMLRSISEPVLKVNEIPWREESRETCGDLPQGAYDVGAAAVPYPASGALGTQHAGSRTVKRFTADYIDHGQGRNKPRLFDQIQPLSVGPKDLESVDITSSMEHVRSTALARLRGHSDGPRKHNSNVSKLMAAGGDSELVMKGMKSPKAKKGNTQAAAGGTPDRTLDPSQSASSPVQPRTYGNLSSPTGCGYGVRTGGFQSLDSMTNCRRKELAMKRH